MPEKIYKTRQAAELLAITPLTLKRWVKQGKIEAMQINARGDYRFSEIELQRYLQSKK